MEILVFFGVLLVIVLAHEFGHFVAAKKSGMRVDEFGFGFPPRLFGKKFGETEYTFNLLPIGGFVKIFGERPNDKPTQEGTADGYGSDRSFINKPKWMQAVVLGAGIAFNVLLAWVLLVSVFIMGAPYSATDNIPKGGIIENPELTVTYVEQGMPADTAGLNPGDILVSFFVDDDILDNPTDVGVQQFVTKHSYDEIAVVYRRGKNISEVAYMIPEESVDLGRPIIGIMMDEVGILTLPFHRALWEGTKTTVVMTKAVAVGLTEFFCDVFTGSADFESVAGPVGIVGIVGDAARVGTISVMILVAVISINLALINLLPFPALDGGRLLFLLIEVVIKRPIKPQVANVVNSIGFFLLLLLMAVITYNDVVKLF